MLCKFMLQLSKACNTYQQQSRKFPIAPRVNWHTHSGMNRHLMLIGLSPLGLILASCGNMNDPVYYDPSFKKPSANPEDNSYEEPQAQAASASAASNEAVLVKPKTTVAEASAAAAGRGAVLGKRDGRDGV